MTEMTEADASGRSVRIQLTIAFMCVALLVYIVLLGRSAVLMITSGRAVAVVLGVALVILPAIGLWAMVATLRAGFTHQKLARLVAADGMELDVSALPRRPSGRIERDAADALFDTVRAELDSDPDDWRRWYRLARAYDYVLALGKTPIVVRDSRGFFTSRVFGTFVTEGTSMLAEGIPAPLIEHAAIGEGCRWGRSR